MNFYRVVQLNTINVISLFPSFFLNLAELNLTLNVVENI